MNVLASGTACLVLASEGALIRSALCSEVCSPMIGLLGGLLCLKERK